MKLTRGFVQGIMNKDLDERLLPQGQYRDGLNVGVSESAQSDVGAIENQLGNTQLSTLVGTNYFTIGAITDPANFNIYWFVTTTEPTGYDYIFRYNETTGTTITILQDTKGRVLKFDRFHVITGVNIIGNLLFWTDDLNPPRRINFTKSYAIDGFVEDDISVIVRPPLFAPTITLSDTTVQNNPNNLEDTFIEFSYRYKYENDEYSAMSPFSSHAFYPTIYNYNYSDWELRSMLNKFNQANVRFHLGGEQVTEIQLLFRESQSTNVNVIDSYRFPGPYNWSFNDNVQASAYVAITGGTTAFPANVGFTTNQVINPTFSNADIPESFEVGDEIVIDQTAGFTHSQYNGTHVIVEILDDYTFIIDVLFAGATGFEGGVATLETKEIEFVNNKLYTVLPADELGRLFDNVPLRAKAQELVGSRLAYGNYVQFFDLIDSSGQPIDINFTLSLKQKDISGSPLPTFRSDRDYECALAYLDDYGRMTTPLVSPTNTLHIGPENSTTANDIRLEIFNKPPAFATHFRVFIKQAKGDYYTIFPLYFYQDGIARWFSIGPGDLNKVKADEFLICKTLNGAATESVEKYKVIEIKAQPKDFLANGAPQLPGVYFKINDPNNLFNFAEQFTYQSTSKSFAYGSGVGSFGTFIREWLTRPLGVVNFPIFYGESTTANALIPSAATVGGISYTAHQAQVNSVFNAGGGAYIPGSTNVGQFNGIRWKITVTDGPNNIFKYETQDIRGNFTLVEDNLTMVGTSPGNAFGYFDNGVFVQVATCRFGHLPNQYKTGDYWTLTVNPFHSGDRRRLYAIANGNGWGVTPNNASPNFGDRPIFTGSRIDIRITLENNEGATVETPTQSWYSSKTYANIEEWWYMENIGTTFIYNGWEPQSNLVTEEHVRFIRGFDVSASGEYMYQSNSNPTPLTWPSWADLAAYASPVRLCIGAKYSDATDQTQYGGLDAGSQLATSLEEIVKVEFNVVQNPNIDIFETLPSLNAPNIYFETNETFKITNGAHVGNITTQATGVPAQISLNQAQLTSATTKEIENSNFNAYCFGNGLEALRIRGGWNDYALQYSPRASSVIDDYQQQRAEEAVTYSGIYRENTGINNLNEFNLSVVNFKYLDRFFGSIQKLYSRDTDLVVFQEDKVSKVLYGKNLLSDAIGGGDIVSIPQVLGTQVAFVGEYGISQNPESFAKWGNDLYFTDAQQGLVLKMPSGQGMLEVSSQGMKDYFKDAFIAYPRTQKLGAFDPFKQQYVLSETNVELPCFFNVVVRPTEDLGNPFSVGSQSSRVCVEIQATGDWTVSLIDTGDGTNWVLIDNVAGTSLVGTGNKRVCFYYLPNTTAANRSLQIDFSGCTETISYPAIQSKRRPIEVEGWIIGEKPTTISNPISVRPIYLKAKQSYTFTSNTGPVIDFKDTQFSENQVTLKTRSRGIAGEGPIPSPSDTIDVKADALGTTTQRPFSPGLGNELRYHVSNDRYAEEDADALLAASTLLSPALALGVYTGSFTYATPNNERYLYLIWDYTNKVAVGNTITSASGNEGTTYATIDYTAAIGKSVLTYNANAVANRFIVKYGGTIAIDTGFVVGGGTVDLIKNSTTSTRAELIVETSGVDDGWSVTVGALSLTSFLLDLNNDTYATVCPRVPATTKYHDGSAALPIAGDIIYDAADGLVKYDGAFAYHKIGAGDDYAYVDNNGLVMDIGSCAACTEIAVPVVNIPNFTFMLGEAVNILLPATNNPIEWDVVSSCESYLIIGGQTGGVYTLTRCNSSETYEVQVGAGVNLLYDSTTTPVLVTGADSSFVSQGVSQDVFPAGLTLNITEGRLIGNPMAPGVYRMVVTATNCFGTSAQDVFIITVGPVTQYRRFNLDSSQPQSNASDACAVTPSYSIYYHSGEGEYPVVNDFVFFLDDSVARYLPYNGGYLWYLMENNTTIRIDNVGQVVDVSICGITKTTEAGDDKTTEDDLDKTIE